MRASDALCRTMPLVVAGSSTCAFQRPRRAPTTRRTKTPRGGLHHARLVEAAVGLGRRPPGEPERLPLDRPELRSPSRQMSRWLFTSATSAPHPVACGKRALPRQRQTSHLRLSSRCCHEFPREQRRPERCVSPTSATDSKNEHLLDCPIPERARKASRPSSCRAPLGQRPWRALRVEPRLTATLQLRHKQ